MLLSAFLSLLREGPGFSRKQQLSLSSLKPVSELTLHLRFSCQWWITSPGSWAFSCPKGFMNSLSIASSDPWSGYPLSRCAIVDPRALKMETLPSLGRWRTVAEHEAEPKNPESCGLQNSWWAVAGGGSIREIDVGQVPWGHLVLDNSPVHPVPVRA